MEAGAGISSVFHASLLKACRFDGTVQPSQNEELLKDKISAEAEFEISMILAHRDKKCREKSIRHYLVQWTGYGPTHNTWEPESEPMPKCSTLIDAYWTPFKGQSSAGKNPDRATILYSSSHDGANRMRRQ